jgi:hypothetical protein
MAIYKYAHWMKQSDSDVFDKTYSPGIGVPLSGIYRCEGCAKEIAANHGDPFPPQNHHQHAQSVGGIKWRLTVFAEHTPK